MTLVQIVMLQPLVLNIVIVTFNFYKCRFLPESVVVL